LKFSNQNAVAKQFSFPICRQTIEHTDRRTESNSREKPTVGAKVWLNSFKLRTYLVNTFLISEFSETDVSLNCGRFYGPIVRPWMSMNKMDKLKNFFFKFSEMWSPRCNDIDRGKPKDSQCHFIHHKSHWIDPGTNPGRRGERPATNRLSYGKYLNY
jgi:hypothetical protein